MDCCSYPHFHPALRPWKDCGHRLFGINSHNDCRRIRHDPAVTAAEDSPLADLAGTWTTHCSDCQPHILCYRSPKRLGWLRRRLGFSNVLDSLGDRSDFVLAGGDAFHILSLSAHGRWLSARRLAFRRCAAGDRGKSAPIKSQIAPRHWRYYARTTLWNAVSFPCLLSRPD